MATLHLMIGLPCSGKTTKAKEIQIEYNALRLTPDEWHLKLFGNDLEDMNIHHKNHDNVESIMWDVASCVLPLGTDVILDFGCWVRVRRDEFRKKAEALGVNFKLHYTEISKEELLQRLENRNKQKGDGVFVIPIDHVNRWFDIFEPPMEDELI